MLRAIYGVLAALPRILDFIGAIIKSVSDYIEERREMKRRRDLEKAIDKARETKDTCDLEKMFDPSKECKDEPQK
jgi:hypothetical protein